MLTVIYLFAYFVVTVVLVWGYVITNPFKVDRVDNVLKYLGIRVSVEIGASYCIDKYTPMTIGDIFVWQCTWVSPANIFMVNRLPSMVRTVEYYAKDKPTSNSVYTYHFNCVTDGQRTYIEVYGATNDEEAINAYYKTKTSQISTVLFVIKRQNNA